VEPDLRILHAVAQAVSRSLDVAEVLRTTIELLPHVSAHDVASLHLIASESGQLVLEGERGLSPKLRELFARLPVGQGQIGGVAATGVTLVLKRATDDPALSAPARKAMTARGLRGLVCVAIRGRDRVLGTVTLGRRTDDPFTDTEVALIEATADTLGFALDNARLHAETRRQLEELQRAHAHLVRAEKLSAVGQLASGVAHEINNPLTTILGQTHLLLAQAGVPQPIRDRVSIIAEETTRAARIVQNLLIFSRNYPAERRPCLIQDQVRRVLDLKSYQLQQDGVDVVAELADCDPVLADEHQLQQVVLSLVQNAQQAMSDLDGPRVLTVRLVVEGRQAILAVLDTGPGLPPEALARVFDPFFTTKPGESSGLGLSMAQGIMAEHGGRLWAENRPEGGAAFFLALSLDH
jgi:C4-dicarboxylate-specific signal transduction histidine kinase